MLLLSIVAETGETRTTTLVMGNSIREMSASEERLWREASGWRKGRWGGTVGEGRLANQMRRPTCENRSSLCEIAFSGWWQLFMRIYLCPTDLAQF